MSRDRVVHPTSRREFIGRALTVGLSGTALGGTLMACGSDEDTSASSRDVVRLGVFSYIPQVIDLDSLVKSYEDQNPGVKIEVTALPSTMEDVEAFVQKLILEARQDKASYDLIFGVTPWLQVAPLARAGALAPLDNLVSAEIVDDMYESVRAEVTYEDGKIYSIPIWTDAFGFTYRTDLLQQYLGTEAPPATWDQVVSMSERLAAELPSDLYAYGADWVYLHRLFLPIFVTLADQPYTSAGLVNMSDPGAVETLELIRTLQPYMPPNANQDLGSSETFQAGKLVMESYWQAQHTRAVTAGVAEDVVKTTSNPAGDRESSLFWTTNACIPAAASNKEGAAKFWVEGFMQNQNALQESVDSAGKILPYTSLSEKVKYPEFMRPLAEQLPSGTPIPMNSAFLDVEQPAFQEQVERMILEGQSPQDTAAILKEAFERNAEN